MSQIYIYISSAAIGYVRWPILTLSGAGDGIHDGLHRGLRVQVIMPAAASL
jgi:hypothetical protein